MQKIFKYIGISASIVCCLVTEAYARGFTSANKITPETVVVEEVQIVENTSPQNKEGVWQDTKSVAGDVWDGTKEVGSDVWDGTKKVTGDVWDGAKEVGGDIKDAVTDDSHSGK